MAKKWALSTPFGLLILVILVSICNAFSHGRNTSKISLGKSCMPPWMQLVWVYTSQRRYFMVITVSLKEWLTGQPSSHPQRLGLRPHQSSDGPLLEPRDVWLRHGMCWPNKSWNIIKMGPHVSTHRHLPARQGNHVRPGGQFWHHVDYQLRLTGKKEPWVHSQVCEVFDLKARQIKWSKILCLERWKFY